MKIRKTTTCHTCRARKLACDGKKPACSQCALSNRDCAGYQHDLIFRAPMVPGKPAALKGAAIKAKVKPKPKPKPKLTKQIDIQVAKAVSSQKVEEEKPQGAQLLTPAYSPPKTASTLRSTPTSSIPPALSWPLLDIISLVVQNFSPVSVWGQNYFRQSPQRICGAWVETLPELARQREADYFLAPAVKTMAVAILARGRNGRAPLSDALSAHNTALSALRAGLAPDAMDMSSCSNLFAAATMCLYLSELILPTSAASTSVHAKGIGDLLQLQSPKFYTSGVAHQLFVGFRPVLLIHAFTSREHSFIEDQSWQTIPFSTCEKSYLQRLLSSAINLPSILGMIDSIPLSSEFNGQNTARKALEGLITTLTGLEETRQKLESECIELLPMQPADDRDIIRFPNITAANFYTYLWGFQVACTLYIRHLATLYPWLMEEAGISLKDLNIDATEEECILMILRSTEFLMMEDFRLYGAASVVMPLDVASKALNSRRGSNSPELLYWHERVSRYVSGKGYPFLVEKISTEV